MKEINLRYLDESWDFDFIELLSDVISIAEDGLCISSKQADWLLKTSNDLLNFYNTKS